MVNIVIVIKINKQEYLFTSSIPTLQPLLRHCTRSVTFPCPPSTVFLAALQMHCKNARMLILCCWALQGYSALGHCRYTFRLGPAGIFGGWTLQGYSAIGHCRILCSWALQGYFAVGHSKDTHWLALQGYFTVGQCKDTLRLGTAGIRGGWAPQGYLVVGHCRNTW